MQAQTYLRKTRWGPHHHHACTKAVTHSIGSQHPRARAVGRFPVVPKRAAPACSTCDTAVSNNAGRLPLTHSLPCCIKLPLPMHTHTHQINARCSTLQASHFPCNMTRLSMAYIHAACRMHMPSTIDDMPHTLIRHKQTASFSQSGCHQ